MARKYAISMTSVGMTTGVNAIYNGLKHFGNDIDFHLISDDKEYAKLNKDIIFHDIDEYKKKFKIPADKRSGWQVRFFRYKLAEELNQIEFRRVFKEKPDLVKILAIMDFLQILNISKNGRYGGFAQLVTFLITDKYQEIVKSLEILNIPEKNNPQEEQFLS